MEPTVDQFIGALRRALGQSHDAAAEVEPKMRRLMAMCRLAVDEIDRRLPGKAGDPDLVKAELLQLRDAGSVILARHGLAPISNVWPPSSGEGAARISNEDRFTALWREISAIVAALLARRERTDDICAFLKQVGEYEGICKTRQDAAHEVPSDDLRTIDRIKLHSATIAQRLGLDANSKLTVRELAGGFSNETFALTFDEYGRYVLRLSRPNGIQWPYVADLAEELPFIDLAIEAGVPVPKVHYLETDTRYLGAPFLVSDFSAGTMRGNSLNTQGHLSEELIRNFANAVAALHSADWRKAVDRLPDRLVPHAALTVTESIHLILTRLRAYQAEAAIAPSPLILILFDWLERTCPVDNSVPVLTHGDLGFHNWLFEGECPTALLDWETIALCSADKDLANVRDIGLSDDNWHAFVKHYVAAGGKPPIQETFRYYAVLRQLHALICTSAAIEKMFTTVDPLNVDYLEIGLQARSYFYSEVASKIATLVEY